MAAEIRLGTINYCILMGRAVADPDLKYTPKGTPVLSLRIAVDRRYKDPASGEWKSDPSFFNVTYFGQFAEKAGEQVKKGSALIVEGRLRSRSWETKNGEKRTVVEIVANRVQCLDKTQALRTDSEPLPAADVEDVEIPADQVDDVPF